MLLLLLPLLLLFVVVVQFFRFILRDFFCIYFWLTVSVTFCFMMSLGAYRYVLLLLLLPLLAIGRVSCGVFAAFCFVVNA